MTIYLRRLINAIATCNSSFNDAAWNYLHIICHCRIYTGIISLIYLPLSCARWNSKIEIRALLIDRMIITHVPPMCHERLQYSGNFANMYLSFPSIVRITFRGSFYSSLLLLKTVSHWFWHFLFEYCQVFRLIVH